MSETVVLELLKRGLEQNDQILRQLTSVNAKQDAADKKLDQHMADEEQVIKGLVDAFPKKPNGAPDFDGHELFHTSLIDESRERTKMFRELRHEIIKKGLWGIVVVLLALITYWWNGHVVKP
jgi:hypothetical protein